MAALGLGRAGLRFISREHAEMTVYKHKYICMGLCCYSVDSLENVFFVWCVLVRINPRPRPSEYENEQIPETFPTNTILL